MLYTFAGLIIEIKFHHTFGEKLCEKYRYVGTQQPDFSVEVTEEMLAYERAYDMYHSGDGVLESLAAYRRICEIAFEYDCMFMHCSAISYQGNGILFTAPSGTGKSTHAALWRKYFCERVIAVNDDKPLLRFQNDVVYVCGTPWDGKHHISNNIMVPVKAIVVLSQGETNQIHKANKMQALYHILNQTIRPSDAGQMQKVLDLTQRLIASVPIYQMQCNISEQAVLTAYDCLKEHFDED